MGIRTPQKNLPVTFFSMMRILLTEYSDRFHDLVKQALLLLFVTYRRCARPLTQGSPRYCRTHIIINVKVAVYDYMSMF